MKIDANDIRVGDILEHDGRLWLVLKTMHTQPGKGGAYMQVEMKDIRNSTKLNQRYRSSETVGKARLDRKPYQFLYADGDRIELMDNETYEQLSVSKDLVGEQFPFLREGMGVELDLYEGSPIALILPETLVMRVEECEPVVKGQTATSSYKPAILENGVRMMVPQFIDTGDKVVIRTSSMEYLERAKE